MNGEQQIDERQGGSTRSAVKALTGATDVELDELGGFSDNERERTVQGDAKLPGNSVRGEPSDAAVLAFSNSFYDYDPPVTDLDYWSPAHVAKVRAALRAATVQGGETR